MNQLLGEDVSFEIAPSERHFVENISDLYAAIVAIEKLEKANHRDLVRTEQYEIVLRRLLNKYHACLDELKSGNPLFKSEASFWETHASKWIAARRRVQQGHPADIEQEAAAAASAEAARRSGVDPKTVAEVVQHFITLMDCLKLQQTAVDQLFPILNDVLSTLKKISNSEFDFALKLESWTHRLENMHPSDELNERDTRELAFDVERAYAAFYTSLGNRAK
jgi:ESCRT-I complex subunit VPS28